MLNYRKPALWLLLAAALAMIAAALYLADAAGKRTPELRVNGALYRQSGETLAELPSGSTEIGELISVVHRTDEHPQAELSDSP